MSRASERRTATLARREARVAHRRRWWRHLAVALLAGGLAGAGTDVWLHHHREPTRAQFGSSDVVDAVVAALDDPADDRVYVMPEARHILDAAGEQAVRRATAAATEVPVYVVVTPPDLQVGVSDVQLGEMIAQRLPDATGVLYLWQGAQTGDTEVLGDGGYLEEFDTPLDFVGDPAVTLPEAVRAAQGLDAYHDDGGGSGDYWGGLWGGSFLGLLIGVGTWIAVSLLLLLVRLVVGRPVPGRWSWRTDDERGAR